MGENYPASPNLNESLNQLNNKGNLNKEMGIETVVIKKELTEENSEMNDEPFDSADSDSEHELPFLPVKVELQDENEMTSSESSETNPSQILLQTENVHLRRKSIEQKDDERSIQINDSGVCKDVQESSKSDDTNDINEERSENLFNDDKNLTDATPDGVSLWAYMMGLKPTSEEGAADVSSDNDSDSLSQEDKVSESAETNDSYEEHTNKSSQVKTESKPRCGNTAVLRHRFKYLEEFYNNHNFPSRQQYTQLQKTLGVSRKYLRKWFCRRRSKDRTDLEKSMEKTILKSRLAYLEEVYKTNPNPDESFYTQMQKNLGVTRRYLIHWFCMRRAKDRTVQDSQTTTQSKLSIEKAILNSRLAYLEKVYQTNTTPDVSTYKQLENILGVSRRYLITWFSKRRSKDKTGLLPKVDSSGIAIHESNTNQISKGGPLPSPRIFSEMVDSFLSQEKQTSAVSARELISKIKAASTGTDKPNLKAIFEENTVTKPGSLSKVQSTSENDELDDEDSDSGSSSDAECGSVSQEELNMSPSTSMTGSLSRGDTDDTCDSVNKGEFSVDDNVSKNSSSNTFSAYWETIVKRNSETLAQKEEEPTRTRRKPPLPVFTKEQVDILEKMYQQDKYPVLEDQKKVAEQFQISEASVVNWFRNRRFKEKREIHKKTSTKQPSLKKVILKSRFAYLEKIYQMNSSPSSEQYSQLTAKLGVSRKYLMRWFSTRRTADKTGGLSKMNSDGSTQEFDPSYWEKLINLKELCKIPNLNNPPNNGTRGNAPEESQSAAPGISPEMHASFWKTIIKMGELPKAEAMNDTTTTTKRKKKCPPSNKVFVGDTSEIDPSYWENMMRLNMQKIAEPKLSRDKFAIEKRWAYLENYYRKNPHPDYEAYRRMQEELGVTQRYLVNWFCMRRAKDRKGGQKNNAEEPTEETSSNEGECKNQLPVKEETIQNEGECKNELLIKQETIQNEEDFEISGELPVETLITEADETTSVLPD